MTLLSEVLSQVVGDHCSQQQSSEV